jgi:hypothetical protein
VGVLDSANIIVCDQSPMQDTSKLELPLDIFKLIVERFLVGPKRLAVLIFRKDRLNHGKAQVLDGVLEPEECEFLGLAKPTGQWSGSYMTETNLGKWVQTDTLAGPRPLQELVKRALSIGFEFKTNEQRDAANKIEDFEMVRSSC